MLTAEGVGMKERERERGWSRRECGLERGVSPPHRK